MPKIDFLSKEDICFLTQMANELKTQDTLATAKPVFWQVEETKRVYGFDPDYSDEIAFMFGDMIVETVEDAKKVLLEYFDCRKEEVELISDINNLEEFCDNNGIDLRITGYADQVIYHGAFLTRSAIEKHLELNGHNYRGKIRRYCRHAFRNPQLKRLLDIIEKFAEVDKQKNLKDK